MQKKDHKSRLAAALVAGALGLCGCSEPTPAPSKSLGRTPLEIERLTQMVEAAYARFGRPDPSEWERGRRELRLVGEPLVSKETLALAEKTASPNVGEATEARMALARSGQLPQLLAGLESEKYDDWRASKYEMLKLGDPGKEALIVACILRFTSEHATQHELARRMLVEIGPDSTRYLAQAFEVAPGQADPGGGTGLGERMPGSNSILRDQCAITLAQLGVPGQEALKRHASSPDEGARLAVAKAMPYGPRAFAFAVLVDYLQRDPAWRVRAEAATGLGVLKEPRGTPVLVQALGDSDPFVRRVAASALGKLGDARSVEALCEALRDAPMPRFPSPVPGLAENKQPYVTALSGPDQDAMDCRIKLVEAMERLGDPRAIDVIFRELAKHPPAMITPLYRSYDHALHTLCGFSDLRVHTAKEWRELLDLLQK
ncbi:MAG: HEAT repeat domain-containing protein [Planctomycetes bacterium]|nr:HEAT repeat domain-containing protein [Planctomycetota bacterium]